MADRNPGPASLHEPPPASGSEAMPPAGSSGRGAPGRTSRAANGMEWRDPFRGWLFTGHADDVAPPPFPRGGPSRQGEPGHRDLPGSLSLSDRIGCAGIWLGVFGLAHMAMNCLKGVLA